MSDYVCKYCNGKLNKITWNNVMFWLCDKCYKVFYK